MTTATQELASVGAIRAAFPALRRRIDGRAVAYFDGPGGTQVPRPVVEAMTEYLYHHNANTHWAYPTSAETDAVIAAARGALADFLGAAPDEIAFGQNMTTLTFHLSRALGWSLRPGDRILTTQLDHHANVDPWRTLVRERGAVVEVVAMSDDATLDLRDLERRLAQGASVLAIGAASNAVGTITDVAHACTLARDAGAITFVDAVHYAPHELVDVRAIGCDFLACSPYKFYGPHLGVLYARRGLLDALPLPKLAPASDAAPERVETGTLSHEAIAGAAAAVDFLAGLAPGALRRERLAAAFDELHRRAAELFERMWNGIGGIAGAQRFGPPPDGRRTPTLAFALEGIPSADVARRLAERGVFVSHGDFYAQSAVRALGAAEHGLVRAGCACYTTMDEVERLLDGVREIARA